VNNKASIFQLDIYVKSGHMNYFKNVYWRLRQSYVHPRNCKISFGPLPRWLLFEI